jgi:hypothetical protein
MTVPHQDKTKPVVTCAKLKETLPDKITQGLAVRLA